MYTTVYEYSRAEQSSYRERERVCVCVCVSLSEWVSEWVWVSEWNDLQKPVTSYSKQKITNSTDKYSEIQLSSRLCARDHSVDTQ